MNGYILKSGIGFPVNEEKLEAYASAVKLSAYISGHPDGAMILEKICRTFMLKNPSAFEDVVNSTVKDHPQISLEYTDFLDIALECN